jgi:hypothetical protein
MIKAVVISSWACAVMLASQFGATYFTGTHAASKAPVVTVKLETRKTGEINIPKIKDGIVRGYVVVRLNYVVDLAAVGAIRISPEIFLNDELFRYIYNDDSIDFDHLEKYDLKSLYASLITRVNERLKAKVVSDIGIQEFVFVPTAEARKRP